MKKIIIFLFLISIFFIFKEKETDILIPDSAIRFRVIANSNSTKDQQNKTIIKNSIEKEIYNLISTAKTKEEVQFEINNHMKDIKKIIESYNIEYNINYGNNYFPTKNYKGIMYPAGNYESLVITLGEGIGDNFWCVLFPPLCLLDNDKEDIGEVEYKMYVKELIDKY